MGVSKMEITHVRMNHSLNLRNKMSKKEFEWNKVDWKELKDINGNNFEGQIYIIHRRLSEAPEYIKEGEICPQFLNDSDWFQHRMYYGLKSGRITYLPPEEPKQND